MSHPGAPEESPIISVAYRVGQRLAMACEEDSLRVHFTGGIGEPGVRDASHLSHRRGIVYEADHNGALVESRPFLE